MSTGYRKSSIAAAIWHRKRAYSLKIHETLQYFIENWFILVNNIANESANISN